MKPKMDAEWERSRPKGEQDALKAQVEEFRAALEFYGIPEHWDSMDLEGGYCNDDYESLDPQRPNLVTGGKRAREVLKKWEKK